MNLDTLKNMLIEHEGMKEFPYRCTAGKLTIGVGRNIQEKGITKAEALFLLDNDITEVVDDLKKVFGQPTWDLFPDVVQLVCSDMRFNMGPLGFREFKNMIAAAKVNDWKGMKACMINSAWYKQVGVRSKQLASMMDTVINHI